MEIRRGGSVASRQGPAEWFTGTVWLDPVNDASAPARHTVNVVSFDPGARTAWHTHPLGQTLYVIAGCGRAQEEGGPVREIRAGDVVWFPPNVRHWHGAAPTTTMTHVAIQERGEGDKPATDWMEHVPDAVYTAEPL
jgi:quercetin dioxygenase-like cupin family protein